MSAEERVGIQPDTGHQVELTTLDNPLPHGHEPFVGDIEHGFFTGLKRRNRRSHAACGTTVAGFQDAELGHQNHSVVNVIPIRRFNRMNDHGFLSAGFAGNQLVKAGTQNLRRQKN